MDEKLQAFKDAWAVKARESRDKARELAEEYVDAHPEEFDQFEKYATEDGMSSLVKLVSSFRKAGMQEEVLKLEAYMLTRFEPQNIGGRAQVRVKPKKGMR